jgi:hypothetical protein
MDGIEQFSPREFPTPQQIDKISDTPDLSRIRAELLKLPGFTLITKAEDRPPYEECSLYALYGMDHPTTMEDVAYADEEMGVMVAKFDQPSDPLRNDFVLYFDDEANFSHMGVYDGEGFVESKWGESDVWKHPLTSVPTMYGKHIKYFRSPLE